MNFARSASSEGFRVSYLVLRWAGNPRTLLSDLLRLDRLSKTLSKTPE